MLLCASSNVSGMRQNLSRRQLSYRMVATTVDEQLSIDPAAYCINVGYDPTVAEIQALGIGRGMQEVMRDCCGIIVEHHIDVVSSHRGHLLENLCNRCLDKSSIHVPEADIPLARDWHRDRLDLDRQGAVWFVLFQSLLCAQEDKT